MDSKYIKLATGALLGGGLGWFVGGVIVEVIRIHEEVDYHKSEEYPQEYLEIKETKKLLKKGKSVMSSGRRNYTKHFKGNPEIAKLIAKYNVKDAPAREEEEIEGLHADSMIEDEFMDEEEVELVEPDIAVISHDQFMGDDEMDKETLKYYSDDVLTDDSDIPIVDVEELIGEDALVSFGAESGDEDVVYVRNGPNNTMYEIIRQNRPYAANEPRAKAPLTRRVTRTPKEEENDDEAAAGFVR